MYGYIIRAQLHTDAPIQGELFLVYSLRPPTAIIITWPRGDTHVHAREQIIYTLCARVCVRACVCVCVCDRACITAMRDIERERCVLRGEERCRVAERGRVGDEDANALCRSCEEEFLFLQGDKDCKVQASGFGWPRCLQSYL